MAKYYGKIGFADTVETSPGVWEDIITEKSYFGDIIRNTRRLQSDNNVNDNINISNQISIISDPYSDKNFHAIRYAEFMGTRWKVTSVEVQFPRLILELGGVFNNGE